MPKRSKQQVVQDRWDNKREQGKQVKEDYEVKPPVQGRSDAQREFLKSINKNPVTVFKAPAGVGKSYLTMCEVTDWLKKGYFDKVTLARPSVGMGKTLGLLPGDLRQKYEVYLMPMVEVIKERYGNGFYESSLHNGTIELVPLEYMRGRNFNHVLVVDESQLMTPDEMYTVLTRMAEGSKLILIGDPTQKDQRGEDGITWLVDFVKRHNLENILGYVEATSDDIERSAICKAVVKAKELDRQQENTK